MKIIVGRTWKAKRKCSGEAAKPGGGSRRRAEFAKDKLRAIKRIAEQQIDVVAGFFKKVAADGEAQNKNGKRELQAKAPENGFELDGLAIGGKEKREAEHGKQAEHSGETSHSWTSFC